MTPTIFPTAIGNQWISQMFARLARAQVERNRRVSATKMRMIEMKFLKLALTLAMLWIAAATYTTAQVVKQSTSNVNKVPAEVKKPIH